MVSFMTTDSPLGALTAIERLVPPPLELVLAESPELARVEPESAEENPQDVVEEAAELHETEDKIVEEIASEDVDPVDPDDPWLEMLETAISADEQIVDVPESAIGEIPGNPTQTFVEQPIVESELVDDMKPTSAGLLSLARTDEDGDDADDDAFRRFLDGDDAADPSCDWLWRPEQG